MILSPSTVRSKPCSPRFRPRLESLESRDCPSAPELNVNVFYSAENQVTLSGQVGDDTSVEGLTVYFSGAYEGTATTDAQGYFSVSYPGVLGMVQAHAYDEEDNPSNSVQVLVESYFPEIVDFTATQGSGNQWTLSGRVIDESAEGLAVHFTGISSLEGQTAVVNADGTFTAVVQLQPGESGTAFAYVDDWFGLRGWGQTNITPIVVPPQLSMNVSYGSQNEVTLSGQVTDDGPVAGLTVYFSGAFQGTATTDSEGNYSVTYAGSLGVVQAVVYDEQANMSNTAEVLVDSAFPEILDFAATQDYGNQWTFSGRVTDEFHEGLLVRFTGLPSLEERSALVNADGTFSIVVELQTGECGTLHAYVDDWFGLRAWAQTTV